MKIIVAEDDKTTVEFLRKGLMQAGHCVECYADGREVLTYCLYNEFDLVIMDRMMPGMDGLTVLKTLRLAGKKEPILFLTAMSDVQDRVDGLMSGGDDYLTKPFHFSELLARITALSRRPVMGQELSCIQVHDLQIDLLARAVRRGNTNIELKSKEFSILEILMRNESKIVTKAMLLERVWDFNFDPQTTVVETHISRLRAKIDKPFMEQLIHTIRNIGYSLYAPQ